MAEWLYEDGIGEARAALVADGRILKARIELPGALRVGTVRRGQLLDRHGRVARLSDGAEVLLDRLPDGTTEGASFAVAITREALLEPGRAKRARGVPTDAPEADGPDLLARITASGLPVRRLYPHEPDRLEQAGWSEVLEEALTGEIGFGRGALRMSPTPAMTLFDVDGAAPLLPLALAGAEAAAAAIVRLDVGGSIGIDLPTLAGRAERQAVDAAVDAALPPPFERTATNGFGFLQIIRPRPRVSLPELMRADPLGAAARAAMRSIERTPSAGSTVRLPAAVVRRIQREPGWLAELTRRTGVSMLEET